MPLFSCKTENTISNKNDATSQKFAEFEEAAKLHSDALAIFYDDILGDSDITRSIVSGNFTKEDIEQHSISAINKAANINDHGITTLANKYQIGTVITKSDATDIEPSEEMLKFVDAAIEELICLNNLDETKNAINNFFLKSEFSTFTDEEQNHIMLLFGVYLDSFSYWDANIDVWCEKLGIDLYDDASVTKGSITPSERGSIRDATRNEYAMADMRGGLWASILGFVPAIGWGLFGLAIVGNAVSSSVDKAIF